jgi:hypothetical protein
MHARLMDHQKGAKFREEANKEESARDRERRPIDAGLATGDEIVLLEAESSGDRMWPFAL